MEAASQAAFLRRRCLPRGRLLRRPRARGPARAHGRAGPGSGLGDRLLGLPRRLLRRERALPPADLVARRALVARTRSTTPGIYLLIAGTYTPFGLLVLSQALGDPGALDRLHRRRRRDRPEAVLGEVAEGALGGDRARRSAGSASSRYSQLAQGRRDRAGAASSSAGSSTPSARVVYALKRPDPRPAVLGYHELFHLCTVAAAACQYVAIAFFVLPRG